MTVFFRSDNSPVYEEVAFFTPHGAALGKGGASSIYRPYYKATYAFGDPDGWFWQSASRVKADGKEGDKEMIWWEFDCPTVIVEVRGII
jgi:hypothetical protein